MATATELGVTRGALRRALREGRIERVGRGYATPAAHPALRLAMQHGGSATCVTGAELHGLWVVHDHRPHLLYDSGRAPRGVVAHRGRREGWADSLRGTLEQAVRCRPEPEALVILESAVVQGRVDQATLLSWFPGNRNGPARRIIAQIDERSMSLIETLARWHLVRDGFNVEPQFPVPGVGHVDLLVEGRVAVELDGQRFHWNREAFLEDRRRGNALAQAGMPCLRFTYGDVMDDPLGMARQIRRLLTEFPKFGGHRAGSGHKTPR